MRACGIERALLGFKSLRCCHIFGRIAGVDMCGQAVVPAMNIVDLGRTDTQPAQLACSSVQRNLPRSARGATLLRLQRQT